MGTGEYDDVVSLVKHCISEDLVDETRVGIGGWSQVRVLESCFSNVGSASIHNICLESGNFFLY